MAICQLQMASSPRSVRRFRLSLRLTSFVMKMPAPLTRRKRLVEDVKAFELSKALQRASEKNGDQDRQLSRCVKVGSCLTAKAPETYWALAPALTSKC
jgi:hypothetical protein